MNVKSEISEIKVGRLILKHFLLVVIVVGMMAFPVWAEADETKAESAGASEELSAETASEQEAVAPAKEEKSGAGDLLDMSLEELMNIEIGTSSLTGATKRTSPSTVTRISQEDIRSCGARSLYEVLDIYVPNFQIGKQNDQVTKMGLRGIIYTREDKYLLLVNGKVMNEHTAFGVYSERDLPMLTDIHHIEVVRGPGSALYGPGALAMVINIVTDNAKTFEGTQVTGRVGGIEEFYTAEVKHGQKFSDGSGLFLYTGMSKYVGADAQYAPVKVGNKYGSWRGAAYKAGDEITDHVPRDNKSYDDWLKWKVHGEYTKGGFSIWARYTRGGEDFVRNNSSKTYYPQGDGYNQGTIYASYEHELCSTFTMKYALSYDRIYVNNYKRKYIPPPPKHPDRNDGYREDEYYGRIMGIWKPHKDHKIAIGYEHSHDEYGLDGLGWDTAELYKAYKLHSEHMPRWAADMGSVFGEYQWNICDQLTTFVGGRLDKHRFTKLLWSPRAAVIYMPTDKDTIKTMLTRSVRTNVAYEMKAQDIDYDSKSDTEQLDALEVRYERQQTESFWWAASGFLHCHDLIGFNDGSNKPIGFMKSYGVELEAGYRTKKTNINFSHGFTKLCYFRLAPGIDEIEDTAAPFGYGNDIAAWSNHVTKINATYKITPKTSIYGSTMIYWGFPGLKDYAEWDNQLPTDYTYNDPYEGSMFLNLGVEHKIKENLSMRVDGYNLLGCVDEDLNKRVNYSGPGNYRCHAPSFGVSLTYLF